MNLPNQAPLSFRSLAKRPGFTAVVVLTLGLGIGANSAIFSVVHAVLFNPLPFREPNGVAILSEHSRTMDTGLVSPITYDDWEHRNEVFSELAAFRHWENRTLEFPNAQPEPILQVTATPNYFHVLGFEPLLGRTHDAEKPGGVNDAVLSHELWIRRFGGNLASGSSGWTNTLFPRHSILNDELPAATSVTGSANSMMLKWFGAVSTRITLWRSDFSVSIRCALAASARAMVKTMAFCMPKFPPIPASLQKAGPRQRCHARATRECKIHSGRRPATFRREFRVSKPGRSSEIAGIPDTSMPETACAFSFNGPEIWRGGNVHSERVVRRRALGYVARRRPQRPQASFPSCGPEAPVASSLSNATRPAGLITYPCLPGT